MMSDIAPELARQSFTCPTCHARSHQVWFHGSATHAPSNELKAVLSPQSYAETMAKMPSVAEQNKFNVWANRIWANKITLEDIGQKVTATPITNLHLSRCYSCRELAVWCGSELIYPKQASSIRPNPDMPDDVKADFEEAARILDLSPRGAAALLRLCVQRLMPHVGETGKNINDDIASLVRKGLPVQVQQALDVVRVIGNNAVHPGAIIFDDTGSVAKSLFNCVNLIVDRMISQKKQLEGLFEGLPEGARDAIKRRDGGQN